MKMLGVLVMTWMLAAQPAQQPAADARAEAERLALTGAYAEALQRFQAIVAASPDDLESRVWIGRLQQRTGHADRAADVFRSVLTVSPDHVDALVGLGSALTKLDRPDEAVEALSKAEKLAPENADLLAAQGAAHLAAWRVRLSLAYYQRAVLLKPGDPAIREAQEEARRIHGHRLTAGGYYEAYSTATADTWSGYGEINLRLGDSIRVSARGQQQHKFGETEVRAGGGVEWRPTRHWAFRGHALAGSDTTVLPQFDGGVAVDFTKHRITYTAGVQWVDFEAARAVIVSPGLTVQMNDALAVLARYSRSETEFLSSGDWIGHDSGLLGVRLRLLPRVWAEGAWATGIENFDTLSIDRLGKFDADTLRGALQIDFRSLTSIHGTYEYQWRGDDTKMLRVTASVVQRF
jgi:tetratricopeptide (TPR) repeat protein